MRVGSWRRGRERKVRVETDLGKEDLENYEEEEEEERKKGL